MQLASDTPQRKWLADYTPPAWQIPTAELRFELGKNRTLVHARLEIVRTSHGNAPLHLNGEDLQLISLKIDGKEQAVLNDATNGLTLSIQGKEAVLETVVAVNPAENSQLMGLYASDGHLCTQCEAEGFRRITYFIDRPDVLTRYRTTLEANAEDYPVLLGNGNLMDQGKLDNGRHYAIWDDPFPKPSYLFAVVAGKLSPLRDSFTTRSGKLVELTIWVSPQDISRCRHAMNSLKQAMLFDEDFYGREYDLDQLNIVAVHDFNFGAMENKGLNIFNAKYILADPELTTDQDHDAIASVIAHEYFHNWSGNRVTCRDWFQLALKEGFTVYRDQQFSAHIGSPAVKRVEDVRVLRSNQFPEDAGPLAHAVRPDSYAEISNFYTSTIYDKGAELVRMMATELGPDAFRRATDRYFAENDGKAATIEDFLNALGSEGLPADLFLRWYEQPGTPRLKASLHYNPDSSTVEIDWEQENPIVRDDAAALPIPCDFALFDTEGRKLHAARQLLTGKKGKIRVSDIAEHPILSLNRGFAAPIIAEPAPSDDGLRVLAAHEDDSFARYEAMQQLMMSSIMAAISAGAPQADNGITEAIDMMLRRWRNDPALTAECLQLPSENIIAGQMKFANPAAIFAAKKSLQTSLSKALNEQLWTIFQQSKSTSSDDLSPEAKGLRRLNGVVLGLLIADGSTRPIAAAADLYEHARGMTNRMAALSALSHVECSETQTALQDFYQRYRQYPDVLDKWFLVQASSTLESTYTNVRQLLQHPLFDRRNPNRLRALMLGFASNHARFHDVDGAGYTLLAEEILKVDSINPQSAARLVSPFTRWRRLDSPYREQMKARLSDLSKENLSRDLREVVATALT